MSAALQAVLADVADRQPRVHELAAYASLAARIEAPLLRRLRQQLLPNAEPGLEADLWFSPLVESFDADACVLHPWIAEQLRVTLKQSGKLGAVWAIVGEAHAAAPPWQRLEEEVAYLSLNGAEAQAAQALRGALKAMVASPERGVQVARWAMHALPRLPQQVAAWPEARALEQGMHARIAVLGAAPRWVDAPVFDHARDGWVLPAAATAQPVAELGLRIVGEALVVCDSMQVTAEARLQIPDSRTRRLQVRSTDSSGRVRYAALRGRAGQRVVFEAPPRDIEITTEAGAVHGLEAVVEDMAALVAAPLSAQGHRSIDDFPYGLFVSASASDREWVNRFREELETALPRLMGRTTSSWDRDGAGSGYHSGSVADRVNDSFAFVLVVSEASVRSVSCRAEFDTFIGRNRVDAQRARVYVVATSEWAIRQWEADASWHERATGDLPWQPFFDPKNRDRPLAKTYEFEARVRRLAEDLSDKMQLSARPDPPPVATTTLAPARPRVQIGVVSLELDGPTASLRRKLRVDLGLETRSCNREALYSEFPEFASADLLLLPFNDSQPMVSTVAVGGHLALQRDAWLRHGKPADALLWVDMRHVPAAQPVVKEHAAFIAEIAVRSIKAEVVLMRLGVEAGTEADAQNELRVFIESDGSDTFHRLDESLRRRYAILQPAQPAHQRRPWRSLRLSLRDVDRMAPPADADAMVLVWTHQPAEAMQTRIEQFESLLPDAIPGLVVCLSPPHDMDRWPQPLAGCTTLRFAVTEARALDVTGDDADRLDRFLLAAMAHRRSPGGSPPA